MHHPCIHLIYIFKGFLNGETVNHSRLCHQFYLVLVRTRNYSYDYSYAFVHSESIYGRYQQANLFSTPCNHTYSQDVRWQILVAQTGQERSSLAASPSWALSYTWAWRWVANNPPSRDKPCPQTRAAGKCWRRALASSQVARVSDIPVQWANTWDTMVDTSLKTRTTLHHFELYLHTRINNTWCRGGTTGLTIGYGLGF
jgi:hypothetical protein